VRGHVALDDLSSLQDLCGLGPLEGLRGEVSIFGGTPSLARVEPGRVATASGWNARACFLVWAQVPRWSDHAMPSVARLDLVEDLVCRLAVEGGLSEDAPLPRISGHVETIRLAAGAQISLPARGWPHGTGRGRTCD